MHEYFVAESQEYDGLDEQGASVYTVPDQCKGNDVDNDLVAELVSTLEADLWTGSYSRDTQRYPEWQGWQTVPELFAESHNAAPFGQNFTTPQDDVAADNLGNLVVYAGNGRQGRLDMNVPADGNPANSCDIALQSDIRLGAFCGRWARIAMYSAPCTLGFDESECPLPEGLGEGFSPWPATCWVPIQCSALQSRVGQTLSFVDVPTLSPEMHVNWYGAAGAQAVAEAWILQMTEDDSGTTVNQPAALVFGADPADLSDRFFNSSLETGEHLEELDPDVEQDNYGMTFVAFNGDTTYFGEQGVQIQVGAQDPESNPNCIPDHQAGCLGVNPPGASFSDCN